jgi:hypothetical protein
MRPDIEALFKMVFSGSRRTEDEMGRFIDGDDDRECCKDEDAFVGPRGVEQISLPTPLEIDRASRRLRAARSSEAMFAAKAARAKAEYDALIARREGARCIGVVFGAGRGQEYTYLVPEGERMPVVGDLVVVPEPYGAYRDSYSYARKGEQIVTVVSVGQRKYRGNLRTIVGRVLKFENV